MLLVRFLHRAGSPPRIAGSSAVRKGLNEPGPAPLIGMFRPTPPDCAFCPKKRSRPPRPSESHPTAPQPGLPAASTPPRSRARRHPGLASRAARGWSSPGFPGGPEAQQDKAQEVRDRVCRHAGSLEARRGAWPEVGASEHRDPTRTIRPLRRGVGGHQREVDREPRPPVGLGFELDPATV